MTILFKAPGEEAEVREITNELETLQELVGGYIKTVPLEGPLLFIVNEDGKMLGLPQNVVAPSCDVLVGPVVVAAYDGGEDFRALTAEDIEFCKEYFAYCEV